MKLTLIQPSMGRKKNEGYVKSWQMEPLSLATLAGQTPEDVEISFYDDRFDEIPYDEPTDLAAIAIEAYTAKRSYEISDKFHEKGVPIIIGGIHPTLIPEEAREHADAIVVGEAEGLWESILDDVKGSKLKKIYKSEKRPSLKGIKQNREIFKGKKYSPITLVESGRGCKFSCDFCSISAFYNQTCNYRPIEDIVNEVKRLEKKNIFFVDDNFVADFNKAKELCKALIPLNKKWVSQGSINVANDEELLKLMEKSGCFGLLIGFESLNKKNLEQMDKSWNTQRSDYETALQKIRAHGISVYATFVFGYDEDTKDSFKEALDFAIRQKFILAAFNHLMPYPGTPLYNRLKIEKRLIYDKWWLDPNYNFGKIVFRPKSISPVELENNCLESRRQFYSHSSMFKRMLDRKANCKDIFAAAIFLWTNLFSRKEVDKRQYWPLGES